MHRLRNASTIFRASDAALSGAEAGVLDDIAVSFALSRLAKLAKGNKEMLGRGRSAEALRALKVRSDLLQATPLLLELQLLPPSYYTRCLTGCLFIVLLSQMTRYSWVGPQLAGSSAGEHWGLQAAQPRNRPPRACKAFGGGPNGL